MTIGLAQPHDPIDLYRRRSRLASHGCSKESPC
ncbi:Uncharacterised protein [Vibrio cholerae]|nr:Uncharacterised protein [Vibrio cholerae]CSC36802.1 Uncharacterised protein [Vibrio cholerae]CSI58617.1 Uncharacterised protein [Vibrio cholerae]